MTVDPTPSARVGFKLDCNQWMAELRKVRHIQ